jgi:membrane associated rhomboid family serine protease
MTNSVVAFLTDWLPSISIIVAIFGVFAGIWVALATRRQHYDEYRGRKR